MNIIETLSNFASCDKYDKKFGISITKSVSCIEVVPLFNSFAENAFQLLLNFSADA